MEGGYTQLLITVGDLICWISNFSDFWSSKWLWFFTNYKEVSAKTWAIATLAHEASDANTAQFKLKAIFSSLDASTTNIFTIFTPAQGTQEPPTFVWVKNENCQQKCATPTLPKNHQICFAFITSILLPLNKVRPISAIKI